MSLLDRFRQAPAEPPPDSAAGDSGVEGERAASAVQRPAFGLMAAIGLGLLGWYYGKVMTSRTASRIAAESSAKSKAEGEINLRPLGRVDPPALVQNVLGDAPEEPPAEEA